MSLPRALWSVGLLLVAGTALVLTDRFAPSHWRGSTIESEVPSAISLHRVARIPMNAIGTGSMAWSPNGRRLAAVTGTSSGRGYEIRILDASTWRESTRLLAIGGFDTRVAFLSDQELATQAYPNAGRGPMALAVYDVDTGLPLRELRGSESNGILDTFAVTGDRRFVVAGSVRGATAVYEARSGRYLGPIESPRNAPVRQITGGPGAKVAFASRPAGTGGDESIGTSLVVEDISTMTIERQFSGHRSGISAIAWSPDGRLIASGASGLGVWGRDPDPLRVWNVAAGTLLASFEGFFEPVHAIAWHPSGAFFATASAKGSKPEAMDPELRERGSAVRLWATDRRSMLFEYKTRLGRIIAAPTFHPLTGQLLWFEEGALHVFDVVGASRS